MDPEPADWTFESSITRPDGTRVHVTVAIPTGVGGWKDVGENVEIAQMTATRAMTQIIANQERCPF